MSDLSLGIHCSLQEVEVHCQGQPDLAELFLLMFFWHSRVKLKVAHNGLLDVSLFAHTSRSLPAKLAIVATAHTGHN